jgi:hypothetical protein
MQSVDELLRELGAAGDVLGDGGFSIDEEQARRKLRQFQLADPRRYVLGLVQAAVHLRATSVAFEIDADDVRVRFDGEPLLANDLERINRSLFAPGGDARTRALRELALALNAAMALNPRFVRLRCVDGTSGMQLELRPDHRDVIESIATDETRALTTVHVRDRFRPGLLFEFFRAMKGELAEALILREHCRWAPIPVLIDGQPIATAPTLGERCLVRIAVDRPGVRGEAGFVDDDPLDPRVDVRGGFVTSIPLPGFPAGFRALVDAPRVRTDLSRNSAVHDDAYDDLVAALEAACEQALVELVELVDTRGRDDVPGWVLDTLRATLIRHGPIERVPREGAPARIAALPLWPTSERWRSTIELDEIGEAIEYVARGPERGLPPGYGDVVLADDVNVRRNLRALFGARAIDRTTELDAAVGRLSQQDPFLGRAHRSTLATGPWLARWWIKTDAFTGEIGVRSEGDPAIRLIAKGRLLESRRIDPRALPIVGLVAVIEGPFHPNINWDRAERDDVLADALLEIVRALEGVVRQQAEAPAIEPALALALHPYLAALARGTFEPTFFAAMGLAEETTRDHLQRRNHASPSVTATGPFGSLKAFATTDGRALALVDIERERAGGPVHVLATAAAPPIDPPALVVRGDRDVRRILEAAFPGHVVRLTAAQPMPSPTRDPAAALLDRVRDQLRALDRRDDAELDLRADDSPALAFVDDVRVVLNARHPVIHQALIDRDRTLVAMATSAVLTALGTSDADVLDLTRRHADLLAT